MNKLKLIIFSIIPLVVFLVTLELIFYIFFEKNHVIYNLNSNNEGNYFWLEHSQTSRVFKKNSSYTQQKFNIKKLMQKSKIDDTFKIAVIGGSSAAGYPYDPSFSFSNLLRIIIKELYPTQKITVCNMAVFAETYSFDSNNYLNEILINYKNITQELVTVSRSNNFKLVLSTLLRNIKDYPPSEYKTNLDKKFMPISPQEYNLLNDNQNDMANNTYRLARWYDQQGDSYKANYYYNKTSDLCSDIGRIHSSLQKYIRKIQTVYNDVVCVDIEKGIQEVYKTLNLGNE